MSPQSTKRNIQYLSEKSFSLVARDPNKITDIKYIELVPRVAANVPIGIDLWVSFKEAERLEPAIIPVTAGKKRPTNSLTINDKESERHIAMLSDL